MAAVVLGAGFGVYQAVDFALITQVLPAAGERAKDLGVINIAAALPQVLAPAIAGLVLEVVRRVGRVGDHRGRVLVAGLRDRVRRRLRAVPRRLGAGDAHPSVAWPRREPFAARGVVDAVSDGM